MSNSSFITTPIYYPNDKPHLGTAYPTVAADILARWDRICGKKTLLLTGTDEHGKKIETAAKRAGLSPRRLVDQQADLFRKTFANLNIQYDRFIRTTDKDHVATVTQILERVMQNGDIYKGTYQGPYCTECEAYYSHAELLDGQCPLHYRAAEVLVEDCYYFRLSRYQGWLRSLFDENPTFVRPASRLNEMVAFIDKGLDDLCISRSSFSWGIPIPFDKDHVTYVWFDALINYLTGAGYISDSDIFDSYWSSGRHIIGKDILRFHAIIFPAMLRSAGLDPPREIFAHGFWTINGRKFSKSLGNAIDPNYLIDQYGLDPLRYYMFRAFPFGSDGDFSESDLVHRNNTELAHGLGNLVRRVLTMIETYSSGVIPKSSRVDSLDSDLRNRAAETVEAYSSELNRFELHNALARILSFVGELNRYINLREPWKLVKVASSKTTLDTTLAQSAEGLRLICILLSPFLPESSKTLAESLGTRSAFVFSDSEWGESLAGSHIRKSEALFPKMPMPGEVS